MSKPNILRSKDDYNIERKFVFDYASFGLKINLTSILILFEKARSVTDPPTRKRISLSGFQLLFSSYEDFALLLHSFRKRSTDNRYIHLTLGVEPKTKQGTTFVPKILKRYESARQTLDHLGFTSVTFKSLQEKYIVKSQEDFENFFKDLAQGVRKLGEYQKKYNDIKNRLKHGKAVFEGDETRKNQDDVVFLRWGEIVNTPIMHKGYFEASIKHLEIAVFLIAEIYFRALNLLWLFMLQYHPDHADDFRELLEQETRDCTADVQALGIKSKIFTEFYNLYKSGEV